MQLGVFVPFANPFHTPDVIAAIGRACDERGVSTIWVAEHVVLFDDDEYASSYPYADDGKIPGMPGSGIFEPFTTLSFLAAVTERVRLATGICLLPQRNPVYAAKEAAAVDWLSNGRFEFGIGVGWLEEEFRVCNVDFARRGARTDEYLELMTALWTQDVAEHHGEFYDLPACRMDPKPVQTPHPPLIFGGESTAALRRVARVGQGWHTFGRAPETLPEPLAELDGLLEAEGRTRADIKVVACPYLNGIDPDMVGRFADQGVDEVTALLFATSVDDVEAAFDAIQPCIDRAAAC